MKIYGFGKSRSFRAVWAAEEAGVDYDYVAVKFGSTEENGTRSEAYLNINTQGKVPSLTDDELVICESGAIVNYLANKADQSLNLIPEDGTAERARYDNLCYFILTELEQPLWNSGKHRFALPEEYRIPALLEKTVPFEFKKAEKTLLRLLPETGFAVTEHFTMADVLLTQTLMWADKFKFEVAQSLHDYKQKMIERPAFKKAEKLVETE